MNSQGITGHTSQIKRLELLIKNKTIPNSILFYGPRGTGKKIIARRFLESIFCHHDDGPCMQCPSCIQIEKNTFPDYIELLPDDKGKIPIGNQEKKEEGSVRWLIDRLSKRPVTRNFGVLIDGIETISTEGQNALLKTIEEPQAGAHIILLTSNKSHILGTILSRCTEIPFHPLGSDDIKSILESQDIESDPGIISSLCGGSMEIALILSDGEILNDITDLCTNIGQCVTSGRSFNGDFTGLQKKIGIDNTLTIIINIYREMLLTIIHEKETQHFLKDFMVHDTENIIKIIKIFLALRKGMANNLNIKTALKGMLYSIEGFDGFGLPNFTMV